MECSEQMVDRLREFSFDSFLLMFTSIDFSMEIELEIPLQKNTNNMDHQQSNHMIMSHQWIRLLLIATAVKSILGLLILFFLFLLSLIVFIVGLRFHHSYFCPVEPKISLFLMIAGVISTQWVILSAILSIITIVQTHFRSLIVISLNIAIALTIVLMNIFLIIWLIFGSLWTLTVLERVQYVNPNLDTFCDLTLFRFTLVYLIVTYILSGLQCWYRLCVMIFCAMQQQ